MAMNPNGVVKGFDIFEYKPVSMFEILDIEAIKPFSLNQRMEGFDTGIIVWISGM